MCLVPQGKKQFTMGVLLFALASLLLLKPSLAEHGVTGEAPSFLADGEPPQKVVVSSEVYMSSGDGTHNLVLPCGSTGDPAPAVTWFREGTQILDDLVMADGTLAMNVTEGVEASRSGMRYHCLASNTIGDNPAILRSSDVNVTYAFFNGFEERAAEVTVDTVLDRAAALECRFLEGNPPPEVEWFMNDCADSSSSPITESPSGGERVRFLEGRYINFPSLSATQRNNRFQCAVVNAYLNMTRVCSPTTYSLTGEIPANGFVVYKPFPQIIHVLGEDTVFTVVVAGTNADGDAASTISLSCVPPGALFSIVSNSDLEITVSNLDVEDVAVGSDRELNFTCQIVVTGESENRVGITSLLLSQPATITSPTEGENPVMMREHLVGNGSITFTCENIGLPLPDVTWYFNGELIPTNIGVTINGNELFISNPQVSHSGIYQCFSRNFGNEDKRRWILEVRNPITPSFPVSLVESNAGVGQGAMADRLEGVVLVADEGTIGLVISAMVASDPCPAVQWSFNGMDISSDDSSYTASNPCLAGSPPSPFMFTLTIVGALTSANSGPYSAVFSQFAATTSLPALYVTIPVPTMVLSLDLEVQVDRDQSPTCLLENSRVILTCSITGFPRPEVTFRRASIIVTPLVGDFARYENITFDQLQISNVSMADQALYSCEAVDFTGRPALPVEPLDLLFCTDPTIVASKISTVQVVGMELEIECTVSGVPIPVVSWTKDGADLVTNDLLFISFSDDTNVGKLRINSAVADNGGMYSCSARNDAGTVSMEFTVDIADNEDPGFFSTGVIIGIAAGGAGLVLIVVVVILLLICVYLFAKRSKSGSAEFQYNVDYPAKTDEYGDGRGNVDADSYEGAQPEAFDPDYDSVPTRRPNEPPPYKATPGYQHGGPLEGDDMEMVKYPPQDSEAFVTAGPPYSRSVQDNGYRSTPNVDDFLSEDAQFV